LNGGGKKTRGDGNASQGSVAPVAAAKDAHALGIGNALIDQVLHAPSDVVLHLEAPLFVAGIEKFLAVSRRSTEVHAQHGVTAIGEELRVPVVAPEVTGP